MTKYIKADLQKLTDSGRTMEQVGHLYGVTRQRMYQIYNALGITTPEKTRKSQLQDWNESQKWLWKIISHKLVGAPKSQKLELMAGIALPIACPILGIPLDYSFGKGVRTENSPSIDQIDAGRGYTADNVHIISWRANRIKNDGTWVEHIAIGEYFRSAERSGAQTK